MLEGTNTVCAGRDDEGYNNYPGIWIAPDKTLTIQGDGSLTAYSNDTEPGGAGIGGGRLCNCGNITITNGVTKVTATKGNSAPNSIGAGIDGSVISLTIEAGANVTQNQAVH